MKISTVSNNSGISRRLILATIRQLGGRESLEDVANHGASGGYSGFTYYTDTVSFFRRNRKDIVEMVKNMAREMGETAHTIVCGFNCLAPCDDQTMESVARCLYGRITDDDTQTANALAWFALEEVARAFSDAKYMETSH